MSGKQRRIDPLGFNIYYNLDGLRLGLIAKAVSVNRLLPHEIAYQTIVCIFRMCKLWSLLNCNHAHSSLHFVEDIQARYIRYSLDVALDTSYPLHQLQK